MKNSGIEWIGEIPMEFDVVPLKYEFQVLDDQRKPIAADKRNRASDNLYPYYGASGQIDEIDGYTLDDDVLLIGEDGANLLLRNLPLIYQVHGKAWINNHAHILKPKVSTNYMYAFYMLESLDITNYISGSAQPKLNQQALLNMPVITPPLDEQNRIANYLDKKCSEIDAITKDIQTQIDTLEQYKRSVITEAVTKGLDPDVEMKDSGIGWFGKINSQISVSRVGLHYDIILGKMICSYPLGKMVEYPYYCAANVHFDGINNENLKTMYFSNHEISMYAVKKGDLLVVEGGAGAGGCAIVKEAPGIVGIQNSIMLVRGRNNKSDARFLGYVIQMLVKQGYINFVCNKATIPHFTKEKLSSVPIPLWSIDRQQQIADYLDTKCAEIDMIIAKKNKQLSILSDYKKSLIYEYVTGKKELPAE